ncbi:MAG TPA: chorismate-binding protein [Propionibacteriaceae bacterium]|nr:chorismate-binding protein [Propionibacteriaceae bacterium]
MAHPFAVPLGDGPSPQAVLRCLTASDRPGCLWGQWFGGGVVLLRRPLHVVDPEHAAAGFDIVDRQPIVGSAGFAGLGGGWLVSLGYERHRRWLGFYDQLLRCGPDGRWTFESLGLRGREQAMDEALRDWRALLAGGQPAGTGWQVGPLQTLRDADDTRDRYLAEVEDAIGRIRRGDFYQVNLCTRLSADFSGSITQLFADMAVNLHPAYGILVGSEQPLASFSPELFLRVRADEVTTSPIKGTAPRLAEEIDSPVLRASAKDAAENIMIVDLMRNDLSRVSRPGTVVVHSLLDLEPHPGVWHLVSTITARLQPGVEMSGLLAATFPPGSVTGAPKSSATAAIAVLEPVSRGAYTGTAGFLSPCGSAELNVVIRSFEISAGRLELGVGGGITADSVPIREWQECLDKAAPLAAAAHSALDPRLRRAGGQPLGDLRGDGVFESILVSGEAPVRLPEHLARLDRSCRELYGVGLPDTLPAEISDLLTTGRAPAPTTRRALRVQAMPAAWGSAVDVTVTVRQLGPPATECTIAYHPRDPVSWRHKWVDRTSLEDAERAAFPDLPYFTADSSVADDARVTETSRGNLFVRRRDGVWLTPPLDDHVLPGVTRRAVLDLFDRVGQEYRVEPVTRPVLRHCRAAFWTSSLSGAVPIAAVDGLPVADHAVDPTVSLVGESLGFSDPFTGQSTITDRTASRNGPSSRGRSPR